MELTHEKFIAYNCSYGFLSKHREHKVHSQSLVKRPYLHFLAFKFKKKKKKKKKKK